MSFVQGVHSLNRGRVHFLHRGYRKMALEQRKTIEIQCLEDFQAGRLDGSRAYSRWRKGTAWKGERFLSRETADCLAVWIFARKMADRDIRESVADGA